MQQTSSITEPYLESIPKNQQYFTFPDSPLIIDSCFPSGNLLSVEMLSDNIFQIRGNPDVPNDPFSKYWFYFRITRVPANTKIRFILKDINSLRKLVHTEKDKRMRPYIVYKEYTTEQNEKTIDNKWKTLQLELTTVAQKIQKIQAEFVYKFKPNLKIDPKINKETNDHYFALNYPYTLHDLDEDLLKISIIAKSNDSLYLNNEILCHSVQGKEVNLITLTSMSNIQNLQQKQPVFHQQLFPNPNQRPLKFRQEVPIIVITGRVHPSEISSSFFIKSLIDFLCLQNHQASKLLRQLFVFYIIPILNPDGVQNGNYRFDTQSRNLNRFYGFSDFKSTYPFVYFSPTIRAVEQIFNHLTRKSDRMMMYFDIHGHNSPKSSFIYSNYTENITHATENRVLCRILESIMNANIKDGFSFANCQYSESNMKIKEKYDHYSKEGSARVYVGRKITEKDTQTNKTFVNKEIEEERENEQGEKFRSGKVSLRIQHSYTLEVCPYFSAMNLRKFKEKTNPSNNNLTLSEFYNHPNDKIQLPDYCKYLAYSFCLSILQLLDINPSPNPSSQSKSLNNTQSLRQYIYLQLLRNQKYKQRLSNSLPKFYQRQTQLGNLPENHYRKDLNNSILNNNKSQSTHYLNEVIEQQYFERWFSNSDYIGGLERKNFKQKNQKLRKFIQKAKCCRNKMEKNISFRNKKGNKVEGIERIRNRFQSFDGHRTIDVQTEETDETLIRPTNQTVLIPCDLRQTNQTQQNSRRHRRVSNYSQDNLDSDKNDGQSIFINNRMKHRKVVHIEKLGCYLKEINLRPQFSKEHRSEFKFQEAMQSMEEMNMTKLKAQKISERKCELVKRILLSPQLEKQQPSSPYRAHFKRSYTQSPQKPSYPYLSKLTHKDQQQQINSPSIRIIHNKHKKVHNTQLQTIQTDDRQYIPMLNSIFLKMEHLKGYNPVTTETINKQLPINKIKNGNDSLLILNPIMKVKLHNRLGNQQSCQSFQNKNQDRNKKKDGQKNCGKPKKQVFSIGQKQSFIFQYNKRKIDKFQIFAKQGRNRLRTQSLHDDDTDHFMGKLKEEVMLYDKKQQQTKSNKVSEIHNKCSIISKIRKMQSQPQKDSQK